MNFKIPDLITKEWLWKVEARGRTNADLVVVLSDLSVIPDELYEEFLSVCQEDGLTVFHGLCTGTFMEEIPSKYFTLERLLMRSRKGRTPLAVATENGMLDYVPFDKLSPPEWEPYTDLLKELWAVPDKKWVGHREIVGPMEERAKRGREKLHRFIREVEVSTTLKEKTPIRVDQ